MASSEQAGNEDLLHQESANARMSPVTVTSEQSISNDFMSTSSGMPALGMDEDGDLEMTAASLVAMDGEPTGRVTSPAGVIDPVNEDSPILTPPLPAVDYLRKVGSPVAQWPPLPPGLEIEGEKEVIWPIEDWALAAQQERLFSPSIELCGFKW
jgi:hypothetical protein